MHVVPELSGEAIGLSITRPIASRTDTNKGERQASDPTALDNRFISAEKPILIQRLNIKS